VSLPGAILAIVTAVMMLMAAGGSHPLWRVEPVNLSEAAALRDRATIVQLIARGEDPYARREVRANLAFNDRFELTPLEAGIATHRAEIVDMILFSARHAGRCGGVDPPAVPGGARGRQGRQRDARALSAGVGDAGVRRRHATVALVRPDTRGRIWAAAGACFVLALAWQFITFNGFPNDHYVHVARARQMLLGAWPVRDFVDPGMPLTYVVSAAGRALIGDVAFAELCIVALGIAIGAAATVLGASRLTSSTVIAIGVALLEVLASPRSYSYPKLLLYCIGWMGDRGSGRHAVRGRPCCSLRWSSRLRFLFRHDHGLYLGVACAIAIALSAPDVTAALRRVGLLGGAVALLLAPWALAVQHYEGLVPYFASAIGFSRREADISILRDWPQLHLSAALTVGNVEAWLYYLFYALPVACLALVLWRRFAGTQTWRGEAAAVVALSVLALEVDKGFLRNPLATRLADATVPACLLGAWLLGLAWSSGHAIVDSQSQRSRRRCRTCGGDGVGHLGHRRRHQQTGRCGRVRRLGSCARTRRRCVDGRDPTRDGRAQVPEPCVGEPRSLFSGISIGAPNRRIGCLSPVPTLMCSCSRAADLPAVRSRSCRRSIHPTTTRRSRSRACDRNRCRSCSSSKTNSRRSKEAFRKYWRTSRAATR
jgi:hypothetical protein